MEKFRKTLVIIGGINFLLWGLYHVTFWFAPFPLDWKNELIKLTEMNSNIMQLLNIGVIVFLLAFGLIMLFCCKEIINSSLGKALQFAFALFWLARLVGEFALPGSSIVFGIILFLLVLIYLIPAILAKKH